MSQKIDKLIQVKGKVSLEKDTFINEELKPYALTHFKCSNCSTENEIKITPYQTGFPFAQLYKTGLLSVVDINVNKIAFKSNNWSQHLGEYLVDNLPTLYLPLHCKSCNQNHIVVFGCGESQPSKWVCKISGVWQYQS